MKEFKVKYYEIYTEGNLEKQHIITKTIKANKFFVKDGTAIFTIDDRLSDAFSRFISVESVGE